MNFWGLGASSLGLSAQRGTPHPRAARRWQSRADPGSAGAQNWPALRLLLASRASGRPGAMGIPIRLAEAGGKAKSRGSLKSSNYVQVRCSDQVPWLHPLCCGARVCLLRTRMHGVPCSHLEARLTSQSRCAGRAAHSTGKNFRSASRPTALSSCSHRCSDEYVCTMVVRVRRARKATLSESELTHGSDVGRSTVRRSFMSRTRC